MGSSVLKSHCCLLENFEQFCLETVALLPSGSHGFPISLPLKEKGSANLHLDRIFLFFQSLSALLLVPHWMLPPFLCATTNSSVWVSIMLHEFWQVLTFVSNQACLFLRTIMLLNCYGNFHLEISKCGINVGRKPLLCGGASSEPLKIKHEVLHALALPQVKPMRC